MESKHDASATLICSVLMAIPIYQLIALEFSKWVIKAVVKIQIVFSMERQQRGQWRPLYCSLGAGQDTNFFSQTHGELCIFIL